MQCHASGWVRLDIRRLQHASRARRFLEHASVRVLNATVQETSDVYVDAG